jgi:hypothetical protein
MGESPTLVEPVNLGIVFVVPLPVTICALAPSAARPNTSSKVPIRFMIPPSFGETYACPKPKEGSGALQATRNDSSLK